MPTLAFDARLAPHTLRCEYFENPIGLDEPRPRFCWQMTDPRRGARQSAYRVLIASSPSQLEWEKGDVWDSGKVQSDESIHVEYAGPKLATARRYFWQVRVWDHLDQPTPWSAVQFFEMGLLEASDWKGSWIAAPGIPAPAQEAKSGGGGDKAGDKSYQPCPYLRKTFEAANHVVRARIYITARGLYELHLNGQVVSPDLFRPGWTEYHQRIPYQTYDVTTLLRPGQNVLGAILGDGWYCGHVAWHRRFYGDHPSLLAQLVVEYADGRIQTIATDASWKVTAGPIRMSDMLMGETYDARLEMPGWDTPAPGSAPGFDDAFWTAAAVEPLGTVPLVAHRGPPVQRIEEIKPLSVRPAPAMVGAPGLPPAPTEKASDPLISHIFDLGQNMVGWVRLKVAAPAGTKITLRFAEVLNPDGSLYTVNLRTAKATDVYICRGDGEKQDNRTAGKHEIEAEETGSHDARGFEVYEPHFTFHGFRYVELTAPPQVAVDAGTITGIVIHSVTPPTGAFACSNPLVNQLQHNIIWGQKGNFLEVPTDCPQRDERLGWMGDIQAFARTAAFNMDVAAFLTCWLQTVVDAQSKDGNFPDTCPSLVGDDDIPSKSGAPGWADAGVIVPWTVYLCYGDTRILERCYPAMQRYMTFLKGVDALKRRSYGDWLHHTAPTPLDLIHYLFYAHSADLMHRIATVLGRVKDAAKYATVFRRVKALFNRRFVTPEGRLVGDSQTAYVLALRFNLLPERLRPRAVEYLVHDIERGYYTNTMARRNWHLSTGFLGAKDLPFALTDAGRLDVACKLLLNEDYPSWLFPVKNGATTIWERWDGWTPDKGFQDPGMNSFNHYAYGAIGQWLYQVVAGIDLPAAYGRTAAGYKHIVIHPRPGPFTWAKAHLESMHGRIESSWRVEGGQFLLEATIPPNTRGTIILPAAHAAQVAEGGQPVTQVEGIIDCTATGGNVVCQVVPGRYAFAVKPA
jgi:alpha-L-rhamnosidase